MRAFLVGAMLCACGSAPPRPDVDPRSPEVLTWIEGNPQGGVATVVVQVRAHAEDSVDWPELQIAGVQTAAVGELQHERVGERRISTRRYRVSGAPGRYQVPALGLEGGDSSTPLWFDLGRPAQSLDGLVDIVDPPEVLRVDTSLIVAGVCVGLTVLGAAGGVALAFGPPLMARRSREVPEDPPDVVALRAWDIARLRIGEDDHAVAVELSLIFRVYVEAVLSIPASSSTTAEILGRLEAMPHLPEGSVGRARRILRAADLIKYADAEARSSMFDELDDTLRAFISSTRPHRMERPS